MMSAAQPVYIGTDGGATTSKVGGVWGDGTTVSTTLLQRPTQAQLGPEAVVDGWVEAITAYLEQNELTWDQVQGVGVAIPGPRRSYGGARARPELAGELRPDSTCTPPTAARSPHEPGGPCAVAVGNDGNLGGVAEAQRVRGDSTSAVAYAGPWLWPWLRLHRQQGSAPRRRHPRWYGGRTYARAAASVRRSSLTHVAAAGRGAASRSIPPCQACRTCWPTSSPSSPIMPWPDRPWTSKSGRWPCAAWRSRTIPGRRSLRFPGARAGSPCGQPCRWRSTHRLLVIGGGPDGYDGHDHGISRALPADGPRRPRPTSGQRNKPICGSCRPRWATCRRRLARPGGALPAERRHDQLPPREAAGALFPWRRRRRDYDKQPAYIHVYPLFSVLTNPLDI